MEGNKGSFRLKGKKAEAFVMFLYGAQLVKRSSVSGALACLRLVLQSLCDFFPPSGTLLDLSGPFLSAGKGVLRYSVPKWLTFP